MDVRLSFEVQTVFVVSLQTVVILCSFGQNIDVHEMLSLEFTTP